jgi:hypothetical protein
LEAKENKNMLDNISASNWKQSRKGKNPQMPLQYICQATSVSHVELTVFYEETKFVQKHVASYFGTSSTA